MTVFLPLLLTGLALCLLCAFHLYLTCPHTGHNPMCRNELLYHYAHRGLHISSIPENSMAAFCRAAEHCYGIELDVRLTSDLHPVIFHDENALRMCGTDRRICDMTLHEVRALRLAGTDEKVPTLQEVLQAVKGRVPLLIELKPAAGKQGRQLLISRVLDSVKEYPGSICMESFDPRILYRLRKSNPDIPRGQLIMKGKDLRFFLLSRLLILFLSRPHFIACEKHSATFTTRTIARLFHPVLISWTIRSTAEWQAVNHRSDLMVFEAFLPQAGVIDICPRNSERGE